MRKISKEQYEIDNWHLTNRCRDLKEKLDKQKQLTSAVERRAAKFWKERNEIEVHLIQANTTISNYIAWFNENQPLGVDK